MTLHISSIGKMTSINQRWQISCAIFAG